MDIQAIMARIKELKTKLIGTQEIMSPVPEETQDDYNYRMIEKMRDVKSGGTPDQETINLMRKQQANGLYPEGNKYLDGSPQQGEVAGAIAPELTTASVRPKPTVFQKPENVNLGYVRPEHEQFLESNVFPQTDPEGLPRELVAGQWAGEGGRKMENDLNNLFGIGPNMKFADLPSNIKTYVSTVKKLLKQRGIEDPSGMTGDEILQIIQDDRGQRYEGHNPDPSEYTRFIPSIPEYRYYKNKKKSS